MACFRPRYEYFFEIDDGGATAPLFRKLTMITYYIDQIKILVQLTPPCFGEFEFKHLDVLLSSLETLLNGLNNPSRDYLSCSRAKGFLDYHKALLEAAQCLDMRNGLSVLERSYVTEQLILAETLAEEFCFYDSDKYYSSKEVPQLEKAG